MSEIKEIWCGFYHRNIAYIAQCSLYSFCGSYCPYWYELMKGEKGRKGMKNASDPIQNLANVLYERDKGKCLPVSMTICEEYGMKGLCGKDCPDFGSKYECGDDEELKGEKK